MKKNDAVSEIKAHIEGLKDNMSDKEDEISSLQLELNDLERELFYYADQLGAAGLILDRLNEKLDNYDVDVETPFRPGQCKTLLEMGKGDIIKKQAESCEGMKKYRVI